jgi:hypothetical protein
VLTRLGFIAVLLLALPGHATAGVKIMPTCASELACDPSLVRTLRDEVARALGSTRVTTRYTLDVSLVRLASTTSGRHVEVRAEVRALLSDAQGRARWHTISRATARGATRDRVMIQRDAVTAAARDVAKLVRSARP